MDDRSRSIRLTEKRWFRDLARAEKKRAFLKDIGPKPRNRNSGIRYHSRILDLFNIDRIHFKKRKNRGPRTFSVPSIFSLTSNGESAMEFVRDIIEYARSARRPRMIIDHRPIEYLGLGAEALLAVVLKEVALETEGVVGAYIRGYKSQKPHIRKMMDEVGCLRVLGTGVDEDIKVSLRSAAHVFRHQNRGKKLIVDALTADPISQTTKDFSDHLDACLSLIKKRLSKTGRARLLSYVAEVLINAQEHSDTAQWVIAGYIDQEDDELIYRAAIFSLGRTIADSFELLEKPSKSWDLVQPYLERHETSGLFSASWRPEDLLTVVALQQNVSSKLDDPDSADRGQGTVDLIEFFQSVSAEAGKNIGTPSVMSILTGKTQITFDGAYKMQNVESLGRMVIAFNKENSLLQPPDRKAVKVLGGEGFPGVMISIVVPLGGGTVESIPESHHAN